MSTGIEFDAPFAPSDEIDLSGDGVVEKEALFTITDVKLEEPTAGNTRYAITFSSDESDFPITERFWTAHSNPKAARAGRAQLKAVTKAATGSDKFSPSSILSQQLYATPRDKDGFAHLTKFRSVTSK